MSTEELVQTLTQANGMINIINKYFITLDSATNSLINYNTIDGVLSLFKMISITMLTYIIFIMSTKNIYLKGVVGISSSGKKNRNKKQKLDFKPKKILTSYVKKEFITLFKNPVYFMQCVLPVVILPIMFSFIFLIKGANNEEILQELEINTSIRIMCVVRYNLYDVNNGIYISNSCFKGWKKCYIYEVYTCFILSSISVQASSCYID